MTSNKKSSPKRAPFPFEGKTIAYPEDLPVSKRRKEIIKAIQDNQVIILAGETGSGKTTQIPKMCIDAGLGRKGRIACTQPRRVAALSVARRVAEEVGVDYGREVGSKIRFDDKSSRHTVIKFMTDGMLLSEIQGDPRIKEYDTIIVDEAHERSLNIDFILGHLNNLRKRRKDLKIIITSATIDTDKFSAAFDNAPVIEVSGRLFPVDVVHAPLDELLEESGQYTYIDGIAESVDRIADEYKQGDILVFLPTEKDIRESMDLLDGRFGRRIDIVPCFGRLSSADQQRIFSTSSKRKLVLATNIAETSLTIPGIRFVIDTGLARISRYNPRTRTKRLPIEKVSQSSANQRKGRCGRVEDGICIRLYSENDFEARREHSVPEIQRSNLAEVILKMKASKLGDVASFPFIDPPTPAAIKSGYALLRELGALDQSDRLTDIGWRLSKLPTDPTVGRMLLEAENENVAEQVLVIASALSIQDPRERPMNQEAAANAAHKEFAHKHSDFLSILNIWETTHDELERLTQSKLRKFCKKRFLSYLRIREWVDVHQQLRRSLKDFEKSTRSSHRDSKYKDQQEKANLRKYGGSEYESIHKCLASGLLGNPGCKEEPNIYKATGNRKVMIFPGSTLFSRKAAYQKGRPNSQKKEDKKTASPQWILAGEIVETNRLYARNVATIHPDWLIELGQHIIVRKYSEPIWEAEEGRVVAKERILLHGLELRSGRVSYLKVDPKKATEIFIREALLQDSFFSQHEFLEHNRKLKKRVQSAQTTFQVSSWIGVDEAAYRFYEKRLENVASGPDLNRFIKSLKLKENRLLFMTEEDLTPESEVAIDYAAFPEKVQLDNSALPIEYNYDPGKEDDGVTLKIPYSKAKQVDNQLLDWLVPGHLEAKVTYLLRALPKDIRRQLAPITETARKIARTLKPTGDTLIGSLSAHLLDNHKIETYSSDWKADAIPNHLQTRIEVHDTKGKTIAAGRDPLKIQGELRKSEEALSKKKAPSTEHFWNAARDQWEIEDIELKHLEPTASKIEIGNNHGIPIFAFPGLRAESNAVALRLFKQANEAQAATGKGIARLIESELRYELAWLEKDLKEFRRVGPVAVAFAPIEQLKTDAYHHIKTDLCRHTIDTIDPTAIKTQATVAIERSKGYLYRLIDLVTEVLNARQDLILDKQLPQDLKAEVEQLTPKRFIRATPNHALLRFPLYFQCIRARQASRNNDSTRDAKRSQALIEYRKIYEQIAKKYSRESIDDLRWMIEEFAISQFAQKLGTAYPISAKRLDEKIASIQGPTTESHSTKPNAKKTAPQKQADKPTKADLDSLKRLFG